MKSKHLILIICTLLIVIADQITKFAARKCLKPLSVELNPTHRYIPVIDGLFDLKYVENPGAVWGLLRNAPESFRAPFFIIVTLFAIAFIIYFFHKLQPQAKFLPFAISGVLGGAVGNLIDRIYQKCVVDFIDWYITFDSPLDLGLFVISAGEHHWPTFNIADIGITVGVVLLFVDMALAGHAVKASK